MRNKLIIAVLLFFTSVLKLVAQDTTRLFPALAKDSIIKEESSKATIKVDTQAIKMHDPNKATFRSAVIPGWGQAYNREYWKIPIVYGALSIPTITFFYNNTWYKRTKNAYEITVNGDTANFANIHPKLQGLSAQSLQFYRNAFRQDRDYSVLWFVVIWGLNVVDATVFGHLKDFDVSDDLSLHIRPNYDPLSKSGNVALVFNLRK